jgi:hypothetical protein
MMQSDTGRDCCIQRKPAILPIGAFDHGASAAAGKGSPQYEAGPESSRAPAAGIACGTLPEQIRPEIGRVFSAPGRSLPRATACPSLNADCHCHACQAVPATVIATIAPAVVNGRLKGQRSAIVSSM